MKMKYLYFELSDGKLDVEPLMEDVHEVLSTLSDEDLEEMDRQADFYIGDIEDYISLRSSENWDDAIYNPDGEAPTVEEAEYMRDAMEYIQGHVWDEQNYRVYGN